MTATAAESRPDARVRSSDRHFLVIAAAIVGVALWLRFHRIGTFELWLDEAFTFEMAATDKLADALGRENNPPLYFLLQRAWFLLFGASEAAFRSLAALFGTAFVAAVIATGRRFLSPAVGLWSGAIAALAPLHVYYSQEARPYSLLVLLLLLAYAALWRAVRSDTPRAWGAFAAVALLALATHYFSALALVPALSLVWLRPEGAERRARSGRALAALALGAAPCLAWLAWSFWLRAHPVGGHAWIARIWENTPPSRAIPKSFEVLLLGSQMNLLPGFFKQFTLLAFPPPLRWLGIALLIGLGLFAVSPWGDRRMPIPGLGKRKAWLCILTFVPLLALWLASFVRPYYVVGRYDLVALPSGILLLGFALAKLQGMGRGGPMAAAAVGLLLAVVLGTKLALYYRASGRPAAPSARQTARALDRAVADGDLVVFTPSRGLSVIYYLRRLGWERRDGICTHRASGRSILCWNVPFDDEGMVLDLDHLDRVAFSSERLRSDLRAAVASLDPFRSAVWVERRVGPQDWLAVERFVAEEAARAGFVRTPAPPPLGGLSMRLHVGADRRPGEIRSRGATR